MRRLPVFFVLDCSESMVGDSLKKMEDGLKAVVSFLRSDPYALESVYVSVVAFAGKAETIVPLVELVSFYMPKLPLGSGTNLGLALNKLMYEIDKSVVKTTHEHKGDWKPIVYIFTDGRPTDNPNSAISIWKKSYANKATVIAISLGKNSDFSVLKEITDDVLIFEEINEGDFNKFINWISASIVAHSKSVGDKDENHILPVFDESIIEIVKDPIGTIDETCVTLVGRCHKTKKPYIIKYDKVNKSLPNLDFKMELNSFHLSGCYPLEEEYFEWSDKNSINSKVNTSELVGTPSCPHCGNATAFAVCGCGKLLCLNGPGTVDCPWCEEKINFQLDNSNNIDGFDIARGKG